MTPSPPGKVSGWYLRPVAPVRSRKSSPLAGAPFTILIGLATAAAQPRRASRAPEINAALPRTKLRLLVCIGIPLLAAFERCVCQPGGFRGSLFGFVLAAEFA